MAGCPTVDLELVQTTRNVNGTRLPFGNSNRENGTTFLDFPLFLGIFQWDEPTKRVPFTSQPEIPEILTKWKAPVVAKLSFPFPSPPQELPGELARRIMEVQRYRSNPPSWDSFFFLYAFSVSEVPDKNNPIRSKLTTRTCWSREEKKERCEANKVFVQSDFGTKCKLKYSLPAWASNLIVVTKPLPPGWGK